MIEIIILYILKNHDCSIYRLMKFVDEIFFAFLKSSAGTINPALKRLEELACVDFREKMSEGGMKTKIYSITKAGEKHLKTLLLTLEAPNPARLLNDIKIAIFVSDVLSKEEYDDFRENTLNILELYKIKLERGLEGEYNPLEGKKKSTVEITLNDVRDLIKALQAGL